MKLKQQLNRTCSKLFKTIRRDSKVEIHLQAGPCTGLPYNQFKSFCQSCEQGEQCSFINLRGYIISTTDGSLVYGPYFPATEKPDLLHRCKSLRFNTKPHSRGANSYALKKIRSTSKVIKTPNGCILTQTNKPIQRDHIEGYCHMCDTCYTRNFIHHYICAYCAVGTCIDCYESLNDTLSGCHSNPVFSEKEHF